MTLPPYIRPARRPRQPLGYMLAWASLAGVTTAFGLVAVGLGRPFQGLAFFGAAGLIAWVYGRIR